MFSSRFRFGGAAFVFVAAATLAAVRPTAGQQAVPADSDATISRVSDYVERYYARAQSIVAREAVILQPLNRDLSFAGFARRLEYELRLEWNPSASGDESPATVVRELIRASGPPLGPPNQPECMDPKTLSPEPLAFLLPDRRHKFRFTGGSPTRVKGRPAVIVDYRPRAPEPPKVEWNKDCAWIDLPGRTRGRIWVDPATAEVMRFDESLVGRVDIPARRDRRPRAGESMYFTIERADTSIRYEPVVFTDPDETLLLPSEIISVSVITNSGVPRLRTTQRFSNYRRFVTESRLVD